MSWPYSLKWDLRFLELAKHVSGYSKDPSTKTGAVIVRPDHTIASVGFNGFPRGCDDSETLYADRSVKLSRVIHCEMNAILAAREPLHGYTLYTYPFCSCDRCAVHVIQAGIKRCVAPRLPEHLQERWGQSVDLTKTVFREAGVELSIFDSSPCSDRQRAALAWVASTFGDGATLSKERAIRFFEEATELVQTANVSHEMILRIIARVYSRPIGDAKKEIGQVGLTLEALAESLALSLEDETAREFERVRTIPKQGLLDSLDAKRASGLVAAGA